MKTLELPSKLKKYYVYTAAANTFVICSNLHLFSQFSKNCTIRAEFALFIAYISDLFKVLIRNCNL